MSEFRYTLNSDGFPIAFGEGDWEIAMIGNEPFTGFDIVDYHFDFETQSWFYDPIIMVPQEISKLQAVSLLLHMGLYDLLITNLQKDPTGKSKIFFDSAAYFQRTSPLVQTMANSLGLNDIQLDEFFVEAKKIFI